MRTCLSVTKHEIPGVRLIQQQCKPFTGSMHQQYPTNTIKNYDEKKWLHRSLAELVMSNHKRTATKGAGNPQESPEAHE